uniref:Uncharacterized protein n=1 Tax=Avena sativa TaxID=4498 RepID=A0ACD6ANR9_AVESA
MQKSDAYIDMLSLSTSKVISLHFSKQGRVLYTASMDGVICELDTRTGKSKDTFKASKKSISYLTISHDEKFMGVSGRTTKLFSVKDKKEVLKIPSEDGPIQLMSVSDDARILVSCNDKNKEVQVWSCDHHSGTMNSTASLVMHTQPKAVECKTSTLYEAGEIVLAVSKKGVAYVWHLQTISQDKVLPTKISVKNSFDKKGRIPIILAKLCDVKEDNTVKEGNPDYNLDEPTMEQKLESLNLLNKSEFLEEQSVSLAPPSADSVHILLKQALRADDHAELLKCLYNRDEKVWLFFSFSVQCFVKSSVGACLHRSYRERIIL